MSGVGHRGGGVPCTGTCGKLVITADPTGACRRCRQRTCSCGNRYSVITTQPIREQKFCAKCRRNFQERKRIASSGTVFAC